MPSAAVRPADDDVIAMRVLADDDATFRCERSVAAPNRCDTRQRADLGVQFGQRRDFTRAAIGAERDHLVGTAVDRERQSCAGADIVEQAGGVDGGTFGQAERRGGGVGRRGIHREVDVGGDRVELQLTRTVVRSLDQVRTAGDRPPRSRR